MKGRATKVRIEETAPYLGPVVIGQIEPSQIRAVAPPGQLSAPFDDRSKFIVEDGGSADHWRKLAKETAQRLQNVEQQLRDLRMSADETRARANKYKERQEAAQQTINRLQIELVTVTAERDEMRAQVAGEVDGLRQRLADQERLAKLVHKFRQEILDGTLFEIFGELVRS